ncbi:MAG: site-specific integrase [Candidatus Thermoplasmatota archaeon]|nr:site-specific integrase [Candidatus Thermoplasmatota archaeon]
MGRYPWKSCTIAYLDAVKPYYGEKTLKTIERGLKIIGLAFDELHECGRASTANPKKMAMKDVEAFLEWMKNRKTIRGIGLRPATQANYIGYLTNLLRWVENPVIDRMKMLNHVRLPQKVSPEVKVLSETMARQLVDSLETMPEWEGCVARAMIAIYLYSGLRRSELRLARLQDVNTETWQILVAHPKGMNKWAAEALAPILPPARQPLLDFLAERKEYLEKYGFTECEPLFPFISDSGRLDYWSDGMWGKAKAMAETHSRIKFKIQQLRATFGQICKDRGVGIESVSKALRHKTTKTTELYYTRIRTDHAFRELENAFSDFDNTKNLSFL